MLKKKNLITLIVLVMFTVFVMYGCGDDANANTPSSEPTVEVSVEPTPTPTPTPVPTPTPETPEVSMVPLVPEEASPSAESSDGDASGNSSTDLLKIEMENDSVTQLQELLKKLGYLDKVTGYFGTDTEKAVKEFQKKNDLDSDGIVGSGTWSKLRSDDAVKAN